MPSNLNGLQYPHIQNTHQHNYFPHTSSTPTSGATTTSSSSSLHQNTVPATVGNNADFRLDQGEQNRSNNINNNSNNSNSNSGNRNNSFNNTNSNNNNNNNGISSNSSRINSNSSTNKSSILSNNSNINNNSSSSSISINNNGMANGINTNHLSGSATIVPQMISGTGSTPHTQTFAIDSQIGSKFTNTDLQILRQLLVAGEKHKWKQITKEINSLSNHSNHVMAALTKKQQILSAKSSPLQHQHQHPFAYGVMGNPADGTVNPRAGGLPPPDLSQSPPGTAAAQAAAAAAAAAVAAAATGANGINSPIPLKNVSPTFVIKQYQQLLGFPNNSLYFGTLASSLPYVVAEKGWSDIDQSAYDYQFHTEDD
ncbi:hypothetical protein LELG_05660 [Lodderomyces elongisporus NRRL YB-4239]|uniref:Uncharacterized protein n=1 Tax=Lodderomyces elongisporus (strain ATCC 11503 / CBS 2605 / JCM 1781 / NBRC 1676 / NRRL YB-4239) TaxID=379508 RepID=A5E7S1_LODEL|nr:hypothetical protein LELG_05660 [Lodderomyces elongisporus NRRL YB-4239]